MVTHAEMGGRQQSRPAAHLGTLGIQAAMASGRIRCARSLHAGRTQGTMVLNLLGLAISPAGESRSMTDTAGLGPGTSCARQLS